MERLRIGLVGLNFGRHIVDSFFKDDSVSRYFDLAAVCDMDQSRLEAICAQYGLKGYDSFAKMMAEGALDAVGIYTGPNGRSAMIGQALDAGMHIMTTKPFERDADAGLAILRRARQMKRALHLNSPSPLPGADTMQILQWQGEHNLGQAIGARWETYARYNEVDQNSWMDDPRRCPVAPVFRLGIYGINELLSIFGPAQAVQVAHNRIFTGRPTPDNAQLSLSFRNGGLASVFASFCIDNTQPYPNYLRIHFERGTISRIGKVKAENGSEGMVLELLARKGDDVVADRVEIASGECSGCYQWRNFYNAIRSGEGCVPGEVTPEAIIDGVRLIAAMERAEQSGMTESV